MREMENLHKLTYEMLAKATSKEINDINIKWEERFKNLDEKLKTAYSLKN